MKHAHALFAVLLFCSGQLLAAAPERTPKVNATVDWSHDRIFLSAALAHASGKTNSELRAALREAILKKLSLVVHDLWKRSAVIGDENAERPEPDLSAFWSAQKLSTFQVAENRASATMEIMLRGRDSLMAYLPLGFGGEMQSDEVVSVSGAYDKRPNVLEHDNSDGEPLLYTGLIIDARHLSFVPSLNAGIYTSSGRQIYGAEFVRRRTAVRRGVTGFFERETVPHAQQRAGKRPLKVAALEVMRDGENGLVISDEDAAKLLAHAGSVQNLRRARVVILVSGEKLRSVY